MLLLPCACACLCAGRGAQAGQDKKHPLDFALSKDNRRKKNPRTSRHGEVGGKGGASGGMAGN
ncbi:unnamed protein product [Periconia digitata]|uniref:Secreted protein n=1 Tax=Periconia digitata TaxID=1303443 RepID=A0A9W4XUI8_9PLEO|nr:unnamed protein product [Periconia digitata]